MVEAVLRYLLAIPLLVAAALKTHSWFTGESVSAQAFVVALLETLAAFGIVLPTRTPRIFVKALAVFLIGTLAVGVWRSVGPDGLSASCGCMGNVVLLRNWQQLLLSSVLLTLVGWLLIVGGESRAMQDANSGTARG